MNKELKKCPFCGGEAKIIHTDDVALPYKVRCKNINCDVRPSTTWFKYEEDAIAKWNTRKPMDEIVEKLEDRKIHHKRLINYEASMGTFAERMQHEKAVEVLDKAIEIVKGSGSDV